MSFLLVGGILALVSWRPVVEPTLPMFLIQVGSNAWQDCSSSRVMDFITAILAQARHVVRRGRQVEVSWLGVVPRDVLLLEAWNEIPAYVRRLEDSRERDGSSRESASGFPRGSNRFPSPAGGGSYLSKLACGSCNKFLAESFLLAEPQRLDLCLSGKAKRGLGRSGSRLSSELERSSE